MPMPEHISIEILRYWQANPEMQMQRLGTKAELLATNQKLVNKLLATLSSRSNDDVYSCAEACLEDNHAPMLGEYTRVNNALNERITKQERLRLLYLRRVYIKTMIELLANNNQANVLLWLAIN